MCVGGGISERLGGCALFSDRIQVRSVALTYCRETPSWKNGRKEEEKGEDEINHANIAHI